MFEITPRAMILLSNFFKDRGEINPVRIFVKLGGCGIRSFGVAIERTKKDDELFLVNGFTFIINKKLWAKVKPIKVDADSISFRISGNSIEPNSGCGTCGIMCGLNGSGRCSGDCNNCPHPCLNSSLKVRAKGKSEDWRCSFIY